MLTLCVFFGLYGVRLDVERDHEMTLWRMEYRTVYISLSAKGLTVSRR
jgi:hypothetical protein